MQIVCLASVFAQSNIFLSGGGGAADLHKLRGTITLRRPPHLQFTATFVFSLRCFLNPISSQARYNQAKLCVHDRSLKVATVIESLEMEMELLCLTGVEDQLQTDVRPTLEILRNAGIKVWQLADDSCSH